ncbi:MAG: hypothetical protein DSY91_02650 [Deltaproteobacteria bacterium]|nr:MAG: hypothetical protein DSY91_02650 [Deltaproteobacteria bacterium]
MKLVTVRFLSRLFLMGLAAALPLVTPAATDAGEILTLRACVERAIYHNNTLRSFASERRAVAMEVKQALAPFYPSLSFGTSFERSDWEDLPRNDNASLDFKARYNLFRGGGDWSTYKSKKHAYQTSEYDFLEESLSVVATVQDTFFAILSLKNRLKILKKSVDAAALHEKLARKRMEAGLSPRSDYLRAQVDLANARVDLVQAQRDMKTLKHTLAVLMGWSPSVPIELEKGDVKLKAGEKSLRELYDLAKKNRPVLRSYQEQVRELVWAEKSVKAEFFPTLDAYAESGEGGEHYFPDQNYWAVGIELQYPFFTGFSTRYAAASTRAKLEAKRWSFKQKILEVQKEIADAYEQFKSDKRVIKARETLVKSALENLKVAQKRYRVGVGSIVELTDARVDATSAAIGLENAKLTVLGDEIELRRATGWFVPFVKSLEEKTNDAKTKP